MKILSNSPGVLWDCHMHSEFSADSGTPTAAFSGYLQGDQVAAAKGIEEEE